MMVRAKRIYILTIKTKQVVFFFRRGIFLTENVLMFSVFLSSYRNTRRSLDEFKKGHGNTRLSTLVPTVIKSSTYTQGWRVGGLHMSGELKHTFIHSSKWIMLCFRLRHTKHLVNNWPSRIKLKLA